MNETTLDIKQIIKTLKKRSGLISKIFFLFVIVAALFNLLIPPTFEGELMLRVKHPKGLANSLLGDIAGGSPMATKQLMSTYAEILKSRIVVEGTIAANKIGMEKDDSAKKLVRYGAFVGRITTQPVRDTEILRVKVTAPSATEAMVWTNSLVDHFLTRITTLAREEQSTVREFVGERLKEARKELDRAETALKEYKISQKIAAPAEETKAIIDRLSTASQLAAQNEVVLAAAQGKLANAQRQLGSQKPGFMADGPQIQLLKGKLTELELEQAKLLQMYTEKHPRVAAVRSVIRETRQKLSNEVARIVSADAPSTNPVHIGVLQARIMAEAELSAGSAQREALQKVISESETELSKLPAKEQGIGRVMRDALVAQEIYSMLAKRYEEARISEVMQPTDAQVVNPAVEPDQRIRPRRSLNVAIAALLGLFCGLGIAFFLEYMNRTVRTADDVKDYLGLPVLGSIPDIDRVGQRGEATGELAKAWQRIRSLFSDAGNRLNNDRSGRKGGK
ncbi:MAG: GumC family protein [Negativicutes bacterium]